MLKGGGGGAHNKFWGLIYAVSSSFRHIEGGGAINFHSFKGGARKVLPCREGGGAPKRV